MSSEYFDVYAAVPAFLSVVATALAAFATWKGPQVAAKLAEQLRREADSREEKRRIKYWVFSTLMQNRAALHTTDPVKAFNLIDVAFADAGSVREAWAEMYSSLDTARSVPQHERDKRLRQLLLAIVADLGLSGSLRMSDFERVYFPQAMVDELEATRLQQQALICELQGRFDPAANLAGNGNDPLPAKPGLTPTPVPLPIPSPRRP